MKKIDRRGLLRPVIHLSFVRAVLGLTAGLLWKEFGPAGSGGACFAVIGIFFLLLGWMAYLRLDGFRLPVIDRRLFEWKRRPGRGFGDMIDFVDEEPRSYEELGDAERDFCRLAANLFCGILFIMLSLP